MCLYAVCVFTFSHALSLYAVCVCVCVCVCVTVSAFVCVCDMYLFMYSICVKLYHDNRAITCLISLLWGALLVVRFCFVCFFGFFLIFSVSRADITLFFRSCQCQNIYKEDESSRKTGSQKKSGNVSQDFENMSVFPSSFLCSTDDWNCDWVNKGK